MSNSSLTFVDCGTTQKILFLDFQMAGLFEQILFLLLPFLIILTTRTFITQL